MAKISGIKKILISRTDAIGDVMLSLPLAGLLKEMIGKDLKIAFFGKTYTYDVVNSCEYVDEFYNYDTFSNFDQAGKVAFLKEIGADVILHVFPREAIASAARQAGIPHRIGTTHRLYHIWNCNHLVSFSRKNSTLHEAQLNTFLLKDLGLIEIPTIEKLASLYGFTKISPLPVKFSDRLKDTKFKLILHPGSNESAREWNKVHYRDLIRYLPPEKVQIIITGTGNELSGLNEWLSSLPENVINFVGRLELEELISLINTCDGLIAASTGPLHIAAALGKHALGIFPPIRPMHPGRWAPIGERAEVAVVKKACSDCRTEPRKCHCINEISATEIADRVTAWLNIK
ncbi:MAG: lipopolysaccharide heptosyltransferase family protein [Bacteroidetes bacterium]|nr:MAG: lipopolysaccharide heptosyltransferase family protein [Bacteroidota bacterium]